ncbi:MULTISPECIES: response regulator transcription factor [unclassified Streptomyces]|uniref:response regulator transcription factor n=1 Tax=unclassified Streptomyces TaxID=2593676 RepID=UPI00036B11A0|nr:MULTISPECIES: response regulator transcription factor [unclassified Streptomyces]MYT30170.1 response regulator [Streptomyces sp. SID8354]
MRVLVVDGEPRTAALLRRGLTEEGYVVDLAKTGPEAVWRARGVPYDLIVLDVLLHGYDGFEVCRRLRAAGCWSPVLVLSARNEISDRVRGLDAGADDYLAKPFSFAELYARLRALARRGAHARPPVMAVGDLRLDPAGRRAWRDGTELHLSAKEFALLELFLRHPGEVLTRTMILEHVWDFPCDGVSNVVDQYVAYLRRKIDRAGAASHLETVRGAGYRLLNPTPVTSG